MSDTDAFGYREAINPFPVASIRVGEGKTADTLEPRVTIYLTSHEPDAEPITLALRPEHARTVGRELLTWAARARAKHWAPPRQVAHIEPPAARRT